MRLYAASRNVTAHQNGISSPVTPTSTTKSLKPQGFRAFSLLLMRAWFFEEIQGNQAWCFKMKKRPTIRMKSRETARACFERFLGTKRADGVKPSTLRTYSQQFNAISKHLDIDKDMKEMTAQDLKEMANSMRDV